METTIVETRITRIPVNKLVISPLNVRKRQATGIEELAALIAYPELIHNLVVTTPDSEALPQADQGFAQHFRAVQRTK
jgi:hypothetical protein